MKLVFFIGYPFILTFIHFATGARSRAAAQGAAAAKCPEHGGRVCEFSAPWDDPTSGKEPEPHPQHQEGEEGGVGGAFTWSFLASVKCRMNSDNSAKTVILSIPEDLSRLWSPAERARRREEETGCFKGTEQVPVDWNQDPEESKLRPAGEE